MVGPSLLPRHRNVTHSCCWSIKLLSNSWSRVVTCSELCIALRLLCFCIQGCSFSLLQIQRCLRRFLIVYDSRRGTGIYLEHCLKTGQALAHNRGQLALFVVCKMDCIGGSVGNSWSLWIVHKSGVSDGRPPAWNLLQETQGIFHR